MAKKVCPVCRKGGYTQGRANDGRPKFTCTLCDYEWTNGKDGGEDLLYPVAQKDQSND